MPLRLAIAVLAHTNKASAQGVIEDPLTSVDFLQNAQPKITGFQRLYATLQEELVWARDG